MAKVTPVVNFREMAARQKAFLHGEGGDGIDCDPQNVQEKKKKGLNQLTDKGALTSLEKPLFSRILRTRIF